MINSLKYHNSASNNPIKLKILINIRLLVLYLLANFHENPSISLTVGNISSRSMSMTGVLVIGAGLFGPIKCAVRLQGSATQVDPLLRDAEIRPADQQPRSVEG